MKKEIIVTADGSHTVSIPERKITYHSLHGAIQESTHVFIEAGLIYVASLQQPDRPKPLHIFEMGFGTGLNAFLTAIKAGELKLAIHYTAIETSPLSVGEASVLNHPSQVGHKELFEKIHHSYWNQPETTSPYFILEKIAADLINFLTDQLFHLVYYDAFAPSAQPELWTKEVFEKLYHMMQPGGVLVTYCSKGDVRRAMLAAGFTVEKIAGPKGKREMVRATKPAAKATNQGIGLHFEN